MKDKTVKPNNKGLKGGLKKSSQIIRGSDLLKMAEESLVDVSVLNKLTDDFSKDWIVDEDGTMTSKQKPWYIIEGSRLTQKDWIKHLLEKGWVDMNTFIPAYFYALKIIGKKEISITVNYSLDINEY